MVPVKPQIPDPQRIREALGAMAASYGLEVHGQLASTNDRAAELAHAGGGPGQVVLAETQTGGRGRRGKGWLSPPGGNIYLSLTIPGPPGGHGAQVLPLAAGVAFAHALEEFELAIGLKWPNDLVSPEGRKVGGILMETVRGKAIYVLGVGLNMVESGGPETDPEIKR